jgi:hypothetical protein
VIENRSVVTGRGLTAKGTREILGGIGLHILIIYKNSSDSSRQISGFENLNFIFGMFKLSKTDLPSENLNGKRISGDLKKNLSAKW